MKNISLLNTFSFYYLWNNGYKSFINNYINEILNTNEEFCLLDFINFEKNSVRSYLIFESTNNIVFIDFNIFGSKVLLENDLLIVKLLESTSYKKVNFIMFNKVSCSVNCKNMIVINYNKKDLIFMELKNDQIKADKVLVDILYKMDKKTLGLYMHEIYLKMKM